MPHNKPVRKFALPTRTQIEQYAASQRINIPNNRLNETAEQVTNFLSNIGLESLISLEDPYINPRHPYRAPGRPPTKEEDPYNSIIRFCHVEGTGSGPLAGVRIGIKDNIAVANVPMTEGTKRFPPIMPTEDAVVVERLLEAGAIITAKTNINCFGDDAFGTTRNPLNPRYFSGGSSSGSAAAVAAGIVDAALGVDQGGSIRNPASYCGIVGLKPTHGLVPTYGLVYCDHTLDSIGPMTTTVADNAAILRVIAGKDWRNPQSAINDPTVDQYSEAAQCGVEGLRIGVITESVQLGACSAATLCAFEDAQKALAKLGADIQFVSVPLWSYAPAIWKTTWIVGKTLMANSFGQGYSHSGRINIQLQETMASRYLNQPKNAPTYTDILRLAFEHINNSYLGKPFAIAHNLRLKLRRQLDTLFDNIDLLITPTTPIPPHELEASTEHRATRDETGEKLQGVKIWNTAVNLSGHPALTVPSGLDDNDLPTGLHIIGRRFDEYTVYQAGFAFEDAIRPQTQEKSEKQVAFPALGYDQ